jgi:polyhydroxyalkanoate synthesis regulator phasin
MLRTRMRVAIGLGALVLVLASLYFVGTALADTPTATQKTDYRQVFVEKLAAALGVDAATLQAKVKDAEKSTVDQAVANGDLAKNRADEIKTEIDKSKDGFLGGLWKQAGKGKGKGPALVAAARVKGAIGNVADKAIADRLGLAPGQLKQELRNGRSLEDLAKAKGLTVQDLYNAAADAVKVRLDTMVKDGNLAQARADEIVQAVREGRLIDLDILPKAPARPAAKVTPIPSKG